MPVGPVPWACCKRRDSVKPCKPRSCVIAGITGAKSVLGPKFMIPYTGADPENLSRGGGPTLSKIELFDV